MMNIPLCLKDLKVKENELKNFAEEVDKNERLKKISPRAQVMMKYYLFTKIHILVYYS